MNSSQTTDTLLMIRPAKFGFNAETAGTNIFQQRVNSERVNEKALYEFDEFVKVLRSHKIYVVILQDPGLPATPDSIFPNNWISFHDESMILYPMLASNRRSERRANWICLLKETFQKKQVIDLSGYENQNLFLEGTGSMVFDRINKVIYGNISSRTDKNLLNEVAAKFGYQSVSFQVINDEGNEIYHTNVLMAIGEKTAVICSEIITDAAERSSVLKKISDHDVVEISYQQLLKFAGNMLLVKNRDGEKFWVMSKQAYESLQPAQKNILLKDGNFIYSDLKTIEAIGGGSARCMMAEVF
ncbi:MAG: amidinotransferase [Chitinophagales bacterium]|nr:amidinotransferase [Chitinophagales bacterium]